MNHPRATHLLIRHQEIALKGKNRPDFEWRLRKNISRTVGDAGTVENLNGRIAVRISPELLEPSDASLRKIEDVIGALGRLGGIAAITPCAVTPPDLEKISLEAMEWARVELVRNPGAKTVAVRTRRVDKKFPMPSAEVDRNVGSLVRCLREGLTVNLKAPDLKIGIEIRQRLALIYAGETKGVRGLPMDSKQRVVCLLSGGIDSPVAAYELMRRGCAPVLLHFHSRPFTSEASVAKVKRLAGVLRKLSPIPLELWMIPLLDIQKAVRDSCNERYRTVHYRRFMMRIAEELANRVGAKALVTGEAIGQVASQTLTNIQVIEEAVKLPVLRPLVASDKEQIITKAREIGTYEISIEPHDDSCVLFAPDKPATQASLSSVVHEDESLPRFELVFSALDRAEKTVL